MAHDVFVSYSQHDKAVADAVVARLEREGVRCWVAPRDIQPGTSWGDAIVDAIAASQVMVLVLSGDSNRSRQVLREVERAVAGDVTLLPFRIEHIDPTGAMAYFLGVDHWLDAMTPPLDHHLDRLSRIVKVLLANGAVPREQLDRPPPLPQRRRSSRARLVIAAAAIVALLAVGAAMLLGRGGDRSSETTSPTSSPSTSSTTTVSVPTVALEEATRFQPVDPDPTDLVPPGPITGFDIAGDMLVYANGPTGVTRVAIDDPANPRAINSLVVSEATQVVFAGDRLVVAAGEYGPLDDVVAASDGSDVATVSVDPTLATTAYGLFESDGFVYLSSHNYVGIIDVTDPRSPALVFEWVPPGSTGNPTSVFVADGIGYFGAGWDRLYIFDLAHPADPVLLGHWVSPDWVIDVVVVDGTAFVTLGDTGVAAIDVTDPRQPRLLGIVTVPGFAGPLAVVGQHAFVGWFPAAEPAGGVAIVDMTDPTAPTLVGSFGSCTAITDLAVTGDHVVVSDETEGLVVLRITGLDSG